MGYKMKGIKNFGEGTPLFQKKKKQQGPINKDTTKLTKSEHPDTYKYEAGEFIGKRTKPPYDPKFADFVINEIAGNLEDRISFIDEDAYASGKPLTKQQKKDKKFLQREADIMRDRSSRMDFNKKN